MPDGLADSKNRDPLNFTLHDWLQAKRAEQDPRDIKEALQDAWQISDNTESYTQALAERGFKLARGDRRGFVAVDYEGNVFAIARWTGIKTKEVRARLGSEKPLPTIEEQKAKFKDELAPRIEIHRIDAKDIRDKELSEYEAKRKALVAKQKRERSALEKRQTKRAKAEQAERQSRYRKGLRGLLDRVTGRHSRIKAINEQALYACNKRNQQERDALIFEHIEARQKLESEKADILARYWMVKEALTPKITAEQSYNKISATNTRNPDKGLKF